MALNARHRQELIAIIALLVGVFVGLTFLPSDLTGPAGKTVGRVLWQGVGLGAVLLPVLGVVVSLAGFGRFPHLNAPRAAVLCTGLVFLVPFGVAIALGVHGTADFPADYDAWSPSQRMVGLIPALLATVAASTVGTAGAVILALLALSGLTIVTVDWHPFRRLAPAEGKKKAESPTEPREDETPRPPAFPAEPASNVLDPLGSEPDDPPPMPRPKRKSRVKAILAGATTTEPGAAASDLGDDLPSIDLLQAAKRESVDAGEEELDRLGQVLIDTLGTFKVEGKVVGRTTGPVVTQYEVAPGSGVKVGRIAALADDLALAMRAQSIRIVAPIPGKGAVGVEVPNPTPRMVTLRELLETGEWDRSRSSLPIALGRDLEGKPVIADLAKMPHLLIAGATGSGKSVCINTIITGLVYRYTPRELRMLMIDPKMVELSTYNALPHLRHPVVTSNKHAAQTLKWAVHEMERRYELFHANGARNLHDFNKKVLDGKELLEAAPPVDPRRDPQLDLGPDGASPTPPPGQLPYKDGILPFIVIIVDELADLMMTVQGEVETPLALLAQKARATGLHLILATQRPSVNVITGLIKANFPSRIAFRVASKVDSRTILDQNGAEALLGNGDMLFLPPGKSEPVRLQGAFISTDETESVTGWYKERKAARDAAFRAQGLIPDAGEEDILAVVQALEAEKEDGEGEAATEPGERDALFRDAAETCIQHQLGSTSLLQRKLRIGYGRAARIIDQLHEVGILGPPDGSKPREVLIGITQLDEYCR